MGKKSKQAKEIAEGVVKAAGMIATIGGVVLKTLADNKK